MSLNISIGIPFYNAEAYLKDAIRSVFAQTHQSWELILVNDGSTDGSLDIAKSVKDPRVSVISDGKNKRLPARLNEIVDRAKFDYIARMDADDLMVPWRLETQLKFLKENPSIDIVSSGVFSVLNNLNLIGIRGKEICNPSFNDILHKKNIFIHAALLARKQWYERNKYNEELSAAEDYELWLRASLQKDLKVFSLPEPLYIYREEMSVSKNKLLRAYNTNRKIIESYTGKKYYSQNIKLYIKTIMIYLMYNDTIIKKLQYKRGHSKANPKAVEKYQEILKQISKVKVAGMD